MKAAILMILAWQQSASDDGLKESEIRSHHRAECTLASRALLPFNYVQGKFVHEGMQQLHCKSCPKCPLHIMVYGSRWILVEGFEWIHGVLRPWLNPEMLQTNIYCNFEKHRLHVLDIFAN